MMSRAVWKYEPLAYQNLLEACILLFEASLPSFPDLRAPL